MSFSEVQFFEHMRRYMDEESQDKLGQPFDFTDWTDVTSNDCPKQRNGYDCGMFALKFADYRTRDKKFTFTQDHLQYFRQRGTWEITQGKWGL